MNAETLLSLLSAAAMVVGQESVKLGTKQAYEALRGVLGRTLGKRPAEIAAGNGTLAGVEALPGKLRDMSDVDNRELVQALKVLMADPAVAGGLSAGIKAELEEASFTGNIVIRGEDSIDVRMKKVSGKSLNITSQKKAT